MSKEFLFSPRSLMNLKHVHPQLVAITHRALVLSSVDFMVTEGRRSLERQKRLVAAGASRTLKSKHLTGHAVDVAAWVDNDVRWDWPLYGKIAEAFKAAAAEDGVTLTWGGDWKRLRDGPHFEIDPEAYPWPKGAE